MFFDIRSIVSSFVHSKPFFKPLNSSAFLIVQTGTFSNTKKKTLFTVNGSMPLVENVPYKIATWEPRYDAIFSQCFFFFFQSSLTKDRFCIPLVKSKTLCDNIYGDLPFIKVQLKYIEDLSVTVKGTSLSTNC